MPAEFFFKSASTRGGTIENIDIRNVKTGGDPVSVTLELESSYSYAKVPEGVKDMPDYWRVLTEVVPPEKGPPHFRKVISG